MALNDTKKTALAAAGFTGAINDAELQFYGVGLSGGGNAPVTGIVVSDDAVGKNISYVFYGYSLVGQPITVNTSMTFQDSGAHTWPQYDLHTRVEYMG